MGGLGSGRHPTNIGGNTPPARERHRRAAISLALLYPAALQLVKEAIKHGTAHGMPLRPEEVVATAWQVVAYHDGKPTQPVANPDGTNIQGLFSLVQAVLAVADPAALPADYRSIEPPIDVDAASPAPTLTADSDQ